MKPTRILSLGLLSLSLVGLSLVAAPNEADARGGRGERRQEAIGEGNPLPIGAQGVAWYTTWETALAEAERSNRPIFFMSAATTCSGVSGVF